jgi:hypothetical protein
MFYDAPGFRLTALELRFASADDLRLLGRKRVVGISFAFRYAGIHIHYFGWYWISSIRYTSPTILK